MVSDTCLGGYLSDSGASVLLQVPDSPESDVIRWGRFVHGAGVKVFRVSGDVNYISAIASICPFCIPEYFV